MASRPQRKKQYLTQQASKQKELRQPNAEEHNDAIEAAVRKELQKQLPQIVQSTSVQEQSVHIGPLPPADEARKYQELLPGFMDRTLALAEGLQKADIKITKRVQIFQAMHSYSALLIAGGIVFAARKRSTNRTIHNAKSGKRFRLGSGYGFAQRRDFEQTPRPLRRMKARSSWQRISSANCFFACSMATESGNPRRNSA